MLLDLAEDRHRRERHELALRMVVASNRLDQREAGDLEQVFPVCATPRIAPGQMVDQAEMAADDFILEQFSLGRTCRGSCFEQLAYVINGCCVDRRVVRSIVHGDLRTVSIRARLLLNRRLHNCTSRVPCASDC